MESLKMELNLYRGKDCSVWLVWDLCRMQQLKTLQGATLMWNASSGHQAPCLAQKGRILQGSGTHGWMLTTGCNTSIPGGFMSWWAGRAQPPTQPSANSS